MTSDIKYNELSVKVSWTGKLDAGLYIKVWTGDPGLAMRIIMLFLDEQGRRDLWPPTSWLSHPKYQDMQLEEAKEDDWTGWSREYALSF